MKPDVSKCDEYSFTWSKKKSADGNEHIFIDNLYTGKNKGIK
jgi:hypothetical protein